MKPLIISFALILASCAHVESFVTAVDAPASTLGKPAKLLWSADDPSDLMAAKMADMCATGFHKGAKPEDAVRITKCERDCLTVKQSGVRGGSKTVVSSDTTSAYNAYTQQWTPTTEVSSSTAFERTVQLKFYRDGIIVHHIQGHSWGAYSDLFSVIREVCEAMGRDFPQPRINKRYKVGLH